MVHEFDSIFFNSYVRTCAVDPLSATLTEAWLGGNIKAFYLASFHAKLHVLSQLLRCYMNNFQVQVQNYTFHLSFYVAI